MRLADFIHENLEALLAEWEAFARTIFHPDHAASVERLRDHARELLLAVAEDMQTSQSAFQKQEKSKGRGPRSLVAPDSFAELHAGQRVDEGFSLNELVSEYRALRASVICLWTSRLDNADRSNLDELTRFNEAIDQALCVSIARYTAQVDRARDLLLGALGHDLRNPLSAVLQSAQFLLRSDKLESPYTKAAARILNSGTRMKAMISDLLDFASTRLGADLPVVPRPMDMGEACQSAVDEIASSFPDRKLHLEPKGDLWGQWDPDRISQMLSNLVGNAVQHSEPTSHVTVVASASKTEVNVDVHNWGVISEARRRTLFEPLKRDGARANISRSQRNLGLGLYISCQIAKAHAGKIEVSSSLADGTRFTVRLPRNNTKRTTDPSASAQA